jgi:hypothetical protein
MGSHALHTPSVSLGSRVSQSKERSIEWHSIDLGS